MKDKDFRLVLVPLLSSMMIATGACYDQSRDDEQYSRVCVDRSTGNRVEDNQCGRHSTGMAGGFYAWYFLSGGGARFMPGIGSPVRGGTFEAPRGYNPATGRADSSSVRRGGFGSSSRGRAGSAGS